MKKTMLAVIIPALLVGSSSVFAYDLVKTDDLSINMNGDIDLKMYYFENNLNDDKDERTIEANFDDLDFTFKYKINDNLTFIAETDWTSEAEKGSEVNNQGAWIGVTSGSHHIRGGFTETSFDPLGIDSSEVTSVGMASGDVDGDGTSHEEAIRYDYETGDIWISATYGFEGDSRENSRVYQMAWKYTPGPLQINGGIGHTDTWKDEATQSAEADYAQMEVEYDWGDLTTAALISGLKNDITDAKVIGMEFDITYMITDKLKFMFGMERLESDRDGSDYSLDHGYTGVKYKFSSNVAVYGEVGYRDGAFIKFNSESASEYDETIAGILVDVNF